MITYHRIVAADRSRNSFGAQLALSLLAAAIAAWLLIGWNDDRLQTQGATLLQQRPPGPRLALDRFRAAKLLNASSQPDAFEALAFFLAGEREKAVAQLEALLRSEPENRTGWLLLADWLSVDDPAGSARAVARGAQLDGLKQPPAR